MKNKTTVLIALILTLLFCLSGFAQESDEFLTLEVLTPSTATLPCQPGAFSLELGNYGTFEELYEISVDTFEQETQISPQTLSLLPQETKRVTLIVTPECHVYGDHKITVFVTNQITGTRYAETVDLSIQPTGIALIAEEVDTLEVNYNKNKLALPIRNIGDEETVYELSVEGESWITLEENEITVGPRRVEKINLISSPPNSTEEGTYDLAVIAKVKATGVEYGKEFNVVLDKPNFILAFILNNTLLFIGIVAIVLVLLVILFKIWAYLDRTKDERAIRKEEKLKEKELRRAEKEKEKEARVKEKEDARLAKEQERERIKKEKEDARLAKEQEKERLKLEKEQAKEQRKLEKETSYIDRKKEALKAELKSTLRKQFLYVDKDTLRPLASARLLPLLISLVILCVVLAVVYFTWSTLAPYLWYLVGAVLILVLLVIGVVMLKRRRSQKLQELFEERNEYNTVVDETKKELGLSFYLIEKLKVAALKTTVSLKSVLMPLVFCIIFVALALASTLLWGMLGAFGLYVTLGLGILGFMFFLFFLLKLGKRKKSVQTFPVCELAPNRNKTLLLGSRYGLGELLIKAKSLVPFAYVSVHRHDTLPTFVPPTNKVFSIFEVKSAGLTDKDVEKTTFRFSLPARWLKKNHIAQEKVRLERYTGNRWSGITDIRVISKDDKLVTFETSHSGLGVFAITGKAFSEKEEVATKPVKKKDEVKVAAVASAKKKTRRSKKKDKVTKKKQEPHDFHWVVVILAGLFLLLIIASVGVGIYSLNSSNNVSGSTTDITEATNEAEQLTDEIAGIESSVPESGIGPFEFVSGSLVEVDLTRFFRDPDGDELTFSHTGGHHLDIEYDNGVAVIRSAAGYSGSDELVFVATDSNADTVESNTVKVTVLTPTGLGVISHWMNNRIVSSVLLVLGIIVLVLLAIELRRRLQDSDDELEL